MKQIFKSRLNAFFIIGIIILYIAFLSIDVFSAPGLLPTRYLKYTTIILCFLLALNLHRNSINKQDSKYVVIAFIFTLIADIFLLFTGNKIAGIFFFCLVQLTYLKRYNIRLFKFGIFVSTVAIMIHLFTSFDQLYIIAGLYAPLILVCAISTFRTKLPKFNLYCTRIGMILFILCDIHVAMFDQLSRASSYHHFASIVIWLFYLPAQFLLALSAFHQDVEN